MANNRNRRYSRRRPPQRSTVENFLGLFERKKVEFRQDSLGQGILEKFYVTRQMWLRFLRWFSYSMVCLMASVLQDSLFAKFTFFGARTDLVPAVILLITIVEGTETGSIFVLLSSILYYFTGYAPGPYVVAFLTVLGLLATVFRQLYWHRSKGALLLCGTAALMIYEGLVFLACILGGLTRLDRGYLFALTGLYSCIAMVLLYPLVDRLGRIGGHTWKE